MSILFTTLFGLLLIAFLAFSARFHWWRFPKKGLPVLMYHHITTREKTHEQYPFTISPAQFERQLELFKKHGFATIGLDELYAAARNAAPLSPRPVVLTFDDGYLNNYTELFPLLKKHGAKAVIFLTVNEIGSNPDFLNWEQVQQMQQSGLVSFGSHSLSHRRLRSLPDDEVRYELSESKKILETRLGRPVTSFCYPFGAFDERIRPLVFKAGYTFDFSTRKGINKWPWNNRKTLYRAFPRGGETLFDFYLQITRGKSKF